jgi:hypothetical protein
MSKAWRRDPTWEPFTYQGRTYSLAHLNSFDAEVLDSRSIKRRIAVNFSDHCFTKDHEPDIDPELLYPDSTRKNGGYFCEYRYQLSLTLPATIHWAFDRKVWNLEHENYAILPTVDHLGEDILYGVVFSLNPTRDNTHVDLVMQVRSAHPRDQYDPVTYGETRFPHLITLRMNHEHPERFRGKGRHKPKPGWKPGQR